MPALTAAIRAAFREHRALVALVAGLVALGFAVELATGLRGMSRTLWYGPSFRYFLVLIPVPPVFAFLLIRLRTYGPDGRWLTGLPGWRAAWGRFRAEYLRGDRVLGAMLSGLLVALTINLFGTWKLRIPKLQPFAWDARFAELDRVLHFGRQPWEWLQPVLGHPVVTTSLDFVYYTWLPMVGLVCAWQAWSPRREARLRFFLVFALVWVGLGDVLATLFSSAGPCFWDELGLGANPYAGLFAYHEQVKAAYPFGTAIVQEGLWQRYQGLVPGSPYTGISAMPSIHVAMPLLYALAGRATARWLGVAFGVYGLLILLGSVHLGWHYAVDGYLSIVAVVLLWWAVGALAKREAGAEAVARGMRQ